MSPCWHTTYGSGMLQAASGWEWLFFFSLGLLIGAFGVWLFCLQRPEPPELSRAFRRADAVQEELRRGRPAEEEGHAP